MSQTPETPRGPMGHYRWVICALLFFATTINYMDRQVLGILAPTLEKEIGWNEVEYARIVMAFQAGGPHAQDRGLEAVAYAWDQMRRIPAQAMWEKPQGKNEPLRMEKHFRIVPRGVALVIGCSTFPTWNGYPGLFASLATGNAVVVKPHPAATLPLAITVRIAREVLVERVEADVEVDRELAYAEIYVTDTLWPDFRRRDLYRAISEYQKVWEQRCLSPKKGREAQKALRRLVERRAARRGDRRPPPLHRHGLLRRPEPEPARRRHRPPHRHPRGRLHRRPDRPMRVLPAVFSHPRDVSFDVAGIQIRLVKGRIQQLDQRMVSANETLIHRFHGQARAPDITRTG